MNILFVSSECVPYAKTGGLGDVISALPKSLSNLKQNVRIIIPYYQQVKNYFNEQENEHHDLIYKNLEVSFNKVNKITKVYSYNIYRSFLSGSNEVIIDFIDIQEFFDREKIYVDKFGKGFSDSAEIYAYFSKAVLDYLVLLDREGWYPDIIHTHDWHTGLIPFFIKNNIVQIPKPVKTVFTIHNMAYQGRFPLKKLEFMDLSEEDSITEDLVSSDSKKSIIYLKAGISCADIVTTVSETYRNELLTPEFGYGLESILEARKESFFGILNGVDYSAWNPEDDVLIKEKYSSQDQNGKAICKQLLIERFKIQNSKVIIGMVSRLDYQKGIEIILEMLEAFKQLEIVNFHIIIVGTGNKKYEAQIEALGTELDFLTAIVGFNNQLAHEIESGSDLFLMPSKYEPCGLNQMYSLKYGTFPIVRKTGGLADTVIDIESDPENGNGFVFSEYSSFALKTTVLSAVKYFNSILSEKNKLISRIMNLNFSWEKSSVKYVNIYNK